MVVIGNWFDQSYFIGHSGGEGWSIGKVGNITQTVQYNVGSDNQETVGNVPEEPMIDDHLKCDVLGRFPLMAPKRVASTSKVLTATMVSEQMPPA